MGTKKCSLSEPFELFTDRDDTMQQTQNTKVVQKKNKYDAELGCHKRGCPSLTDCHPPSAAFAAVFLLLTVIDVCLDRRAAQSVPLSLVLRFAKVSR